MWKEKTRSNCSSGG